MSYRNVVGAKYNKMNINPDIFEAIMLICFGCAWPLSIAKMLKTKSSGGKSVAFLCIVLVGYFSGICFEITGEFSKVIILYILNTFLVSTDLFLTIKYSRKSI